MERKYGCLESPIDLRDFIVSTPKIELPEAYTLEHTTIKDQGSVNSCVAHSLSSLIESKLNSIYSTGWIYGYRPKDYYQGEGMYTREALKTLLNLGAVKNEDFNYYIEMKEAKTKVDENLMLLEVLAEDCKIDAYARLTTENEIKSWIYTKQIPVPVCIATDNLQINKDNIIKIPSVYPMSGHAMLALGWNELGFIVQNSWGKEWGKDGLAILPYEYAIREAWGISLSNKANPTKDENIKKPKFYIIRKLLQILIESFSETVKRR